jgi:hypothetical protein
MAETIRVQPREIGEVAKRALRAHQVPAGLIVAAQPLLIYAEIEHRAGLSTLLSMLEARDGALEVRPAGHQQDNRLEFDALGAYPALIGAGMVDWLLDVAASSGDSATATIKNARLNLPIWEALLESAAQRGWQAVLANRQTASTPLITASPALPGPDIIRTTDRHLKSTALADLQISLKKVETSLPDWSDGAIHRGADRAARAARALEESIAVELDLWLSIKKHADRILMPIKSK